MRRVELMKQRHDMKIALRRANNAVAKMVFLDEDGNPPERVKDKVRAQVRRNLRKSQLKRSLRRTDPDPCNQKGSQ